MSESLSLPPQRPTILSFTGPDAVRFLNGQITQDVSGLSDRAHPACVTDAKGRLQFFVTVFTGPGTDSLWITCPKEQSEGLRERLERYLIADDVEVDDLTGRWTLVHSSQSDPSAAFTRRAHRHFGEGHDLWWETDSLPRLNSISNDQAERLRIAGRIPAWGSELSEGMLPPEAGLDRNSVSYQKGCYIGQEVLSRIKTAGKLNRRLAAFKMDGPASPGDVLLMEETEVGRLTSSALSDDPGSESLLALGYLKKKGFEASEFVIADASGNQKGIATFTAWA